VHNQESGSSGGGAEDLVEFQRRENELRKQASNILPERQYQVLIRRMEGQSYEEIGSELGIDPATARVHMSRAANKPELRRIAE
jgi:DNA-directed RNA polymerase specialized sigma24 family protein